MQEYNGTLFEGNAQSFRVVTLLEAKRFGPTRAGGQWRWVGLDLTRATLRALMKYPWTESSPNTRRSELKFGAYDDDSDSQYYDWVWEGATPTRNLAAAIMNFADDVAYAVHDFEDGVWSEMIPLYDLLTGNERARQVLERKVLERDRKTGHFSAGEFEASLEGLLDSTDLAYLREVPFDRTRYARAALKDFTASLIHEFIHETTVDGCFKPAEGELRRRLDVLKGMAWQWMIERSDLETFKHGQQQEVVINTALLTGQGAEMAFSRGVLLVEREGDKLFFETLRRRIAPFDETGGADELSVVWVGSNARFGPWIRLLEGYTVDNVRPIEWLAVADALLSSGWVRSST
jgi:dGTP triphosphohydrolase